MSWLLKGKNGTVACVLFDVTGTQTSSLKGNSLRFNRERPLPRWETQSRREMHREKKEGGREKGKETVFTRGICMYIETTDHQQEDEKWEFRKVKKIKLRRGTRRRKDIR